MKVAAFMVPAQKVVTVCPLDPIRKAMSLMLTNNIGAIVVIESENVMVPVDDDDDDDDENNDDQDNTERTVEKELPMPRGIITKTDIVKAYESGVPAEDPCESIMNTGDLKSCTPGMSRDKAARLLDQIHTHHLIVVDEQHSHFVGLISSFDIAAECARDDRAWPWVRSADGKFHDPTPKPKPTEAPQNDQPHYETIIDHKHDSLTYEDYLDLQAFQ